MHQNDIVRKLEIAENSRVENETKNVESQNNKLVTAAGVCKW